MAQGDNTSSGLKAEWHVTGQGHYYHSNKANETKKHYQKALEKNIWSIITAENSNRNSIQSKWLHNLTPKYYLTVFYNSFIDTM